MTKREVFSNPFQTLVVDFMRERGLNTLAEFAEYAQINRSTVYGLASRGGETNPSLATLVQLARALNRPTHELLYMFVPDAPGAPDQPVVSRVDPKERLRAIGQQLPDVETFLRDRRQDAGEL